MNVNLENRRVFTSLMSIFLNLFSLLRRDLIFSFFFRKDSLDLVVKYINFIRSDSFDHSRIISLSHSYFLKLLLYSLIGQIA